MPPASTSTGMSSTSSPAVLNNCLESHILQIREAPHTMSQAHLSDAAIELKGVEKVYRGGIYALRGIDMRIERGEIFGLLGPNGAGKSTLVKILMTVISPTRCDGSILGHRVGDKSALARVGYLPEHHRFPDYLTGAQIVDFFGALAGTPRQERKQRIGELLELVGMTRWADTRIKQYSKGMRQRIGIAQALINDPELVLLDEPTDGVDPVGRRDIRDIVRTLRERGKTVLINSHLLSELEMVCDRVAIMVQGQVRSFGTLDELTSAQRRYEVEFEGDANAVQSALQQQLAFSLSPPDFPDPDHPAPPSISLQGQVVTIGSEDPADAQPVIDKLRHSGVVIRAVRPLRPSLEDLFIAAVGDDEGPGAAPGSRRAARKQEVSR